MKIGISFISSIKEQVQGRRIRLYLLHTIGIYSIFIHASKAELFLQAASVSPKEAECFLLVSSPQRVVEFNLRLCAAGTDSKPAAPCKTVLQHIFSGKAADAFSKSKVSTVSGMTDFMSKDRASSIMDAMRLPPSSPFRV